MFLDIIHPPVYIYKHRSVYITKHNVSETGFCLRLHVKPTQLGPLDRASPYLRLGIETESNLRNIMFWKLNRTVFLDIDWTMDNIQKHNIYTNVPSSHTFRSCLHYN
jgi:hypothetical protein